MRPSAQSAPGSRSRLAFVLSFAFLLALATALRMLDLGTRSLWLDEAASSMLARTDLRTFVIALFRRQSNMALYYLVLRGWIHFGSSEAVLRLPSVIFGAAAVVVMYKLTQTMSDPRTAWIASFLMTVNVFHLQYSQEARGYSLVVFLALLSCFCFIRLLASATRGMQGAYIVTSVLMVYAHVFGVWILLAQWLAAVILRRDLRNPLTLNASVISALASPLVFILLFVSDRSQLSWMNRGSASSLYGAFLNFSGDGKAATPLLVLYAVLLLVSVRSHLSALKSPLTGAGVAYVFVWIWLLLPPLIAGIISACVPILQSRYLIVCLPAFLFLVADGLAQIRAKTIFVTALLAISGFSFVGLHSYYQARVDLNHSDNWRDATAYCLSQSRPGDGVLFTYSAEQIPFRHYQDRLGRRDASIVMIPRETELDLLTRAGMWATPALADDVASHYRRLWVITALQPSPVSSEAQAALHSQLREDSRRNFGFVTVQLFVRSSG